MANMNLGNTLSKDQCDMYDIHMEEANDVLAFYNNTMNETFEIEEDSIDTATTLRLNNEGVPEICYHIYKNGRLNREVVNDYESTRAVYRHIELDEELVDPITGDVIGDGEEE